MGTGAMKRSSGAGATGLLVALIILFVGVGLSRPALAYVDLGTGSYMLQLATAGAFGMIFAARSLWASVRAKFRRRSQ